MFFTEKDKEEIINLYVRDKKSIIFISKKFNCHFSTISNYLEKWGIKRRTPKENKKYSQDSNIFEKIDSEEKAYWLGFLYADGYITNRKYIGISLSIEDIEHLEKFKCFCSATNPIHIYDGNNFGEGCKFARLEFKNEKMANDLISHGCFQKKSLILLPPPDLSQDLKRHFLRGYFDGDGSLCIGKYISFKVCGTKEFLEYFCKQLNNNNYQYKLKLFKRNNDDKNNFYISFGGRLKVYNAMRYLYKNSNIYLKRKYELFNFLCTAVEPIRNDGC